MKLAYWVYKRFILLTVAYGGVLVSISFIPKPSPWSISSFIGEVLFSPLKLLVAILLFVIGFLAYSLFVRDVVRICNPRYYHISFKTTRLFFVFIVILSWIHLLITGGMLALLGLVLALWYGIMDMI